MSSAVFFNSSNSANEENKKEEQSRDQKDWERRFADLKEQALTKLLLCAMGCTRHLRTSPSSPRS